MWDKGCSNDLKYVIIHINFLNNLTKLYKKEIFIVPYIYFKLYPNRISRFYSFHRNYCDATI